MSYIALGSPAVQVSQDTLQGEDKRSSYRRLTASHRSLWPHPTSIASLFFSSAFQSSPLAKPRTEIAGLGPPFPAPSLPLFYSHLHRFPSAGGLSSNNCVPCTTGVLQPAQQTGHREAAPTSWWPLALFAFPRGEQDPLSDPFSLKVSHLHVGCASLSFNAGEAGGLKQLVQPKSKLFTRCRTSPLQATISRDFACLQPSRLRFLRLHSLVPCRLWRAVKRDKHELGKKQQQQQQRESKRGSRGAAMAAGCEARFPLWEASGRFGGDGGWWVLSLVLSRICCKLKVSFARFAPNICCKTKQKAGFM